MAGTVAVFDFDKTIVDVDSDNWVVDELGFTDLFNQLLPTMPWNSLVDRMMQEMHSKGKTIDDIEEVLSRIPIHPRIVPAIKSAYALGCELRIVSDANTFFIETVLNNLGLRDYFSEINTNPGLVDEEGRVRIFPFHDVTKSPHGCPFCPPNMCKIIIRRPDVTGVQPYLSIWCFLSQAHFIFELYSTITSRFIFNDTQLFDNCVVIDRIQLALECNNKRIIYLGDGARDFCPSLRLKETDYVMPRKNFPVWDLICDNPVLIKAEIHEWADGEEQERVILELINKILMEEEEANCISNSNLFAADCKLQTISVGASHDNALLKAVPVAQ